MYRLSLVIQGDLTNQMLHFPTLLPSDFEPWFTWTRPQNGKTTAALAERNRRQWKTGLAVGVLMALVSQMAEKAFQYLYTRLRLRPASEYPGVPQSP
jgi:hypothetical protein